MQTDHGPDFKGSFACLCKVLGIMHQKSTIGKSKGNAQVERVIRMIKDAIRLGLSQWMDTFWSNHVGPVLMLLQFMIAQATM